MIKINLIVMGDLKEKYLCEAVKEYQKRLSRFCNLNIIELDETIAKNDSQASILEALQKDAEKIAKHLSGFIFVLDSHGQQFSSEQLADKIDTISNQYSTFSFVIGASNGIDDSIKTKANTLLSFSKMTFPHQLMRVIFLEQLYRAFTINGNLPYHK